MPNPVEPDSITAEDMVAAISAERPRKSSKHKFTHEQLRAAVEKFGNDNHAIAAALQVSISSVNRGRLRIKLPRPVFWNEANRQRLLLLATQSPRPSNEALAHEFRTTTNAITTALSRLSITVAGTGRKGRNARDLSALLKRKCLTCDRPFVAEHKHNRICRPCNDLISEMVA
jgi:hypothetical protein